MKTAPQWLRTSPKVYEQRQGNIFSLKSVTERLVLTLFHQDVVFKTSNNFITFKLKS